MHTDKDLDVQKAGELVDAKERTEEDNLKWLLDMEGDEPEESLFKVDAQEYMDEGLSDYEAEVAARPMFRGNEGGDDLASYVAEEIVISSESTRSDIYVDEEDSGQDEDAAADTSIMAIDHSRRQGRVQESEASGVTEGSDILGLAGDDDMGEAFMTIKRVKSGSAAVGAAATATVANVVNGPASTTGTGGQYNGPDLEKLTEAPVPTHVADPEDQQVANETCEDVELVADAVPQEAEPPSEIENLEPAQEVFAGLELEAIEVPMADLAEAEEEEQEEAALSLLDYVAAVPQPEDDDEFDQYLLQGGDLEGLESDPEDIGVEHAEGVISLDTGSEVEIDYHEDFELLDGVGGVAAIIPAVMQELNEAVAARLAELHMAGDSLRVDAMLGADEESRKRCYADGFEPLCSVLGSVPAALAASGQEERDAVYVRLQAATGERNYNDLFGDEFAVDGAQPESLAADEVEALDVFGDAFNEEMSSMPVEADALESLGDDLGDSFGEDLSDSFGEDLAAGFGEDLGDSFAAELDADVFAEVSAIDEQPPVAGSEQQPEAVADDIFGDDLSEGFDDFEAVAEGAQDIDDAFSSLSAPRAVGGDEICGLDAQEFAEEAALEEVVEAVEPEIEVEAQIEVEIEIEAEIEAKIEAEVEPEIETEVPDVLPDAAAAADGSDNAWCIPPHIKFSYTSASGAEIFADFLDAFIEEGSAEIEKLEDLVSEWEKDIAAEEVFAEVARTLHTVKGIAKGVGLQRFGTLIHNYETLLEALPRPEADDAQSYFRVVNVWLDAVVRGIEFVTDQRQDIASELPQVGKTAIAQESDPAQEDAEQAAAEVEEQPAARVMDEREKKRDQELADEGAKALAAQQSVRITSEKLDHLLNLTSQTQQLCVRASQNTTRSKRSTSELQGRLSSVRTHIGKIADRALLTVNARAGSSNSDLDALEMDQYSELQEAASILREGVEDLADLIDLLSRQNTQVEALLKQQSSVISSISSSIQAARVVPVSRLMPSLRRIVRTVSTDLDKAVTFKVLNEVGALDRDHHARLQVVLEHMVRNALDHGIESPQQRLALGKPSGGRITIDVAKSGGDYVIKLSDDGRGIDPDAIRESAYEKGLDLDVDALSDEEAQRLIFHKGFSTASEVSEISGRGVGMDIVLTELQQIGGDIEIKSVVGKGTSFEVRIPSNVTVNGALLVTAGDSSYAIPLNGLIAVEQVPVDDYFSALERGEKLSIYDMECEPAYLATMCQGVGLPERGFWDAFVPVIVAGSEGRFKAIAIDNVKEALELVVRSLGSQFSSVPGVAGAATTADGEAIVALDLNLLVDSVGEDGIAPVAVSQEKDSTLLALVVDDSRTQRMVATSQLDTVGVETVTAENGLVAIDLLNATHRLPDVVLLDVEMPVKDGIETLREIRKSQRYGHLPVIMVTSRTGAKHRALAKEAGCNAYMGKPFNFPALVEQINVLTGHDLQLS